MTNDRTEEEMRQILSVISHIVSVSVTKDLGSIQGAILKGMIKDPNSKLIKYICKTLEGSVVYEDLIKKIDVKLDKQRTYLTGRRI